MDLNEYSESLRRELLGITRFAGEDVSRVAEMLMESLDSRVRLALLDVLSAAADEITSRLDGAVIEVRLAGPEPEFVVTLHQDAPEERAPEPGDVADDAGQARLTLRMPEGLKSRAEAAAADSGMSVNAWLVRAVTGALDGPTGGPRARPRPTIGSRYTGFARS
jgi:HicB-like protein involved in pilus formation